MLIEFGFLHYNGVIVPMRPRLKLKVNMAIPLIDTQLYQHMVSVTTLALGSWLRQGITKVRAKSDLGSHISCSWECKKVRRNEPPHSQMSSHFGTWSPNELLNF